LYILISLACGIIQKLKIRELLVEPALMILLCVSMIILVARL